MALIPPLEQQVLRSAPRRKGSVVKGLARGMTDYRSASEEREPLTAGRMLVITACPAEVRRTTRESALQRDQIVQKWLRKSEQRYKWKLWV